ncbi:MAG: PDZ domain-containing protein [Acidobacteriota bacterium]
MIEPFGLGLETAHPGKIWIQDASLRCDEDGVTITSGTTIGSPLYRAGLDRGDRILRIDNRPIESEDDFEEALSRLRPGDRKIIRAWARAGEVTAVLDFRLHPERRLVERNASDAKLSRLRYWLASKVQ